MKCILENSKATNVKGANCTEHKSVITIFSYILHILV